MFQGELRAICVTPERKLPMQSVPAADVEAGKGLAGDRYFLRPRRVEQQLTLIEEEAIAAACQEYHLDFDHADTRRNLLTSGVPLNHLVGRTFRVGDVLLRGVELCEPCNYLEALTCQGIRESLVHRGGLRAEVLSSGRIQIGDLIQIAEAAEAPPTS